MLAIHFIQCYMLAQNIGFECVYIVRLHITYCIKNRFNVFYTVLTTVILCVGRLILIKIKIFL